MNLQQCWGILEKQVPLQGEALAGFFFKPEFFCHEVINSCHEESPFEYLDADDFIKRLVMEKPAIIQDDNYVTNLYKTMEEYPADQLIKVAQVTDTHLDLDYLEGTNVDCGMVLCCRREQGFGDTLTYN
jgi:hypothetical protein